MPGVAFPGPGAGGNFLEQILGDLLQLMGGSSAGGARIDLARTLAQGVASGGEPERNVEPADPPAESADPASRPIFVWNPAAGADSFPPEAAELTPKPRDWSLRGRHEGPAED